MIRVETAGCYVYINNEGAMAYFMKFVNAIEICDTTKWTNFSGKDASKLKENLDALCDKQCPKCLSIDVECTRLQGRADDLHRWNCNYCGILSKPNKRRKEAYESWHGDQYGR